MFLQMMTWNIRHVWFERINTFVSLFLFFCLFVLFLVVWSKRRPQWSDSLSTYVTPIFWSSFEYPSLHSAIFCHLPSVLRPPEGLRGPWSPWSWPYSNGTQRDGILRDLFKFFLSSCLFLLFLPSKHAIPTGPAPSDLTELDLISKVMIGNRNGVEH